MNKFNKISWLRRFNNASSQSRCLSSSSQIQTQDINTWNTRIHDLIRRGQFNEARSLFDQLTRKNTVTWNAMITGYVRRRDMDNARKLFDQMPDRDVVSWNTMISGYARIGRIADAGILFNTMPNRNVVSWNAMLTGILQNGDVLRACEFHSKMLERDSASLSALLYGLIQNNKLDLAMKYLLEHDGAELDGKQDDLLHAYNTLIAGFGQRGRVDDARRLFDMIPSRSCDTGRNEGNGGKKFERNIVSWNSMIMCYVKTGDVVSARSLFDQMKETDSISWNTMISGYAQVSNMREAVNLFQIMPDPDIFSWNSIVSGFTRIGKVKHARDVFEKMPQRNTVSWNSMISGYVKNKDLDGALTLYSQMQLVGHKPDRHTLSSVLAVCAEVATLELGMQIHQQVIKLVIPDIPIKNSLVTMYSRCGYILEAATIFEEVKMQKKVISWNAMIGAYASHGLAYNALELFKQMKLINVRPTYITFISVLSACANAGLVEEAKTHFKSMVSEFGIEPAMQHYGTLVNMLCRHGQIEEAVKLIKSMPMQPDKFLWGGVLGACSVHNNVEYAREAAEALMKIEPESSEPYVSLSNILAYAGRWEEANEVRLQMDKNNILKERGHSRIDYSSRCW